MLPLLLLVVVILLDYVDRVGLKFQDQGYLEKFLIDDLEMFLILSL